MPLLQIKNLQLEFGEGANTLRAVDDVSLSLDTGETLCLVGESGSGKSVTALSIARLVPSPPAHYVGGEVLLEGRDVLQMDKRALRKIRGGVVSYIFQEPGASLNPVSAAIQFGEQGLEPVGVLVINGYRHKTGWGWEGMGAGQQGRERERDGATDFCLLASFFFLLSSFKTKRPSRSREGLKVRRRASP